MGEILTLRPAAIDWYARGLAAREAGDIASALRFFQQAVECAPKHAAAWLGLGKAQSDAKDWGNAENSLLAAIDADQTYIPAWEELAELYGRMESANQERFCLSWLLLMVPAHGWARARLARRLQADGKDWEAKRQWMSLLRLAPASPEAQEAREKL